MKSDICIVSVSWIRTPEERSIVLETIHHLSNLKVPVVIVDGGSTEEDKQTISRLPNIRLLETDKGLTDQLLLSYSEGSKLADSLFYLHTDKLGFVKSTVPLMIDAYHKVSMPHLLIPSRDKTTMKKYPPYQRTQEEFLNFFMSDYIGIKEDYYAGPKIFPSSLVSYLDHLHEDIGWGIEAYFYVIAHRLKIPFKFFPFGMEPPVDVDNEEKTKLYRLKITKWQIEGFITGRKVNL